MLGAPQAVQERAERATPPLGGVVKADLPHREAARVVVVEGAGRTLLFRYENSHDGVYWASPGGGLEPGESALEAARRELTEEVGHEIEGPFLPLREWTHVFTYHGVRVRQHDVVFGVRTPMLAVSEAAADAHAADLILESRWWSYEELVATGDTLWPDDLPDLVRDLQRRAG